MDSVAQCCQVDYHHLDLDFHSTAKQNEESANACEFEDTTAYNHSAHLQESGTYEGGYGSMMHCNTVVSYSY